MREGRLGYNSYNKRYGLLSSDLWIDPGFHCRECLEVLVDDQLVKILLDDLMTGACHAPVNSRQGESR